MEETTVDTDKGWEDEISRLGKEIQPEDYIKTTVNWGNVWEDEQIIIKAAKNFNQEVFEREFMNEYRVKGT